MRNKFSFIAQLCLETLEYEKTYQENVFIFKVVGKHGKTFVCLKIFPSKKINFLFFETSALVWRHQSGFFSFLAICKNLRKHAFVVFLRKKQFRDTGQSWQCPHMWHIIPKYT